MLRNRSVATIDKPEFIDITPCNDLISECTIKVLYLGENRNHSFITKETAIKMANSLPGTPIVAKFVEDKDDFSDHGHSITIEDGEVKFECKTVPYGFVAPDAKVWFQKYLDEGQVEREYLVTTGYLWTGQYPEIQKAIDEGLPQSMELEESTLTGSWSTNNNTGVEFFIINDATFTKLCVLGSDVEPCFEGASVVSKEFSHTPEFVFSLLQMRKELNALYNEGGSEMPKNIIEVEKEILTEFSDSAAEGSSESSTESTEETSEEESSTEDSAGETEVSEGEQGSTEETEEQPPLTEVSGAEEGLEPEEGEKAEEEEESSENFESIPSKRIEFEKEEDEQEPSDDSAEDSSEAEDGEEEEEKKPSKEHSLAEELEGVNAAFAALKEEFESKCSLLDAANEELEALRAFKLGIENEKKDALIAKYHMLDDVDKADVVEHKNEYSIEDIQAKLAVKYVEKFADFSTLTGEAEEEAEEAESPITTFSLDGAVDTVFVPEHIRALREAKENN